MKYLLTFILLVIGPFTDLDRIATVNKLKKEAKEAYNNGDYQKALDHYTYLVDSMEVVDDNITLNMANAFYKLKDTTNAVSSYQELVDSENNLIRSVAQQQLGIVANRSKKYKEALDHFKEALKADPTNEEARYNYELLKKVLKEQEEKQKDQKQDKQDKQDQQKQEKDQQKQDQQKQDQEKQDQENKDKQEQQDQQKDGEEGKEDEKEQKEGEKDEKGEEKKEKPQEPKDGEESDEENKNKQDQMSSLSDKLDEMKISEEKAKMILEALKNKEIQYYQQNKRKATKRNDPGKPDW